MPIKLLRSLSFWAACSLGATLGSWCLAASPPVTESAYPPLLEPTDWQTSADRDVAPVAAHQAMLDQSAFSGVTSNSVETTVTGEHDSTSATDGVVTRRGVQPYGGGHAADWSWGCGGSPFRNGPGTCDTWEVGCRWDVAVDGLVMHREEADLDALAAAIAFDSAGNALTDPALEQFDYGPGGRVSLTSKVPGYDWQMNVTYEGIEEWNASAVFPKFTPFPDPDGAGPALPPVGSTEQRSLFYRSSLHSGELNFVRMCSRPEWRPYCGVRYFKFDDEINDFINQEAPPPLPGNPPDAPVTTTDRLNLFDIENNMIGFQVGVRHDLWHPTRRLTLQGFVNTGVYHNSIKYSNLMGQFSTQEFADDTSTANVNESRIDFSDVANHDVREFSEISYVSEASLSGVCQLNRCWALRAGYQALWINNLHMADDAFLDTGIEGRSLFFHGWHAGVEHRR